MSRSAFCVKQDVTSGANQIVDGGLCNRTQKPTLEKSCYERDCQPVWHTNPWNKVFLFVDWQKVWMWRGKAKFHLKRSFLLLCCPKACCSWDNCQLKNKNKLYSWWLTLAWVPRVFSLIFINFRIEKKPARTYVYIFATTNKLKACCKVLSITLAGIIRGATKLLSRC